MPSSRTAWTTLSSQYLVSTSRCGEFCSTASGPGPGQLLPSSWFRGGAHGESAAKTKGDPSSKWWLRNFFFFYPPHLTEIQEFFLLKGCSCGIVSCIYHELSTWKEIGAGQPVRQKENHQGQAWDSSEPTILQSSWPAVSEEDVASTVSCKQCHLGNHLQSCGPPCPHLISVVDTVC